MFLMPNKVDAQLKKMLHFGGGERLSEDKKKMYYYYGGKEKKAAEVKKGAELAPYSVQRDFDKMIERFEREFEDFWQGPPRMRRWMQLRHEFPIMPFGETMLPSVDLEDRGKDYSLTVDLPGFNKENIEIEVADDSVIIHTKKTAAEEEKKRNYVRRERATQTYYRRIQLPEKVRSEDAKASLNNGILKVVLSKKEPKETKKLTVM
jgi:HSP20 family protein